MQKLPVWCVYKIGGKKPTQNLFFFFFLILGLFVQTQYNKRFYYSSSAYLIKHQQLLHLVNLLEFWQR